MIEDAELLRRYAAEKSEEAFAELVRRHLDLVYSTALRQLAGDTHLAQDVAQTVFTALARKASSLTERGTLAGWLYLGAHHAAAQAVRGEQRRRAREQEASIMHELTSPPDAATDWDRVRPVLDEALRELNDADREAVLLRYFERRPFAEIGAMLRLREDAARMRVDRALEKLRALLARRGVTSTALALGVVLSSQAVSAAPALLTTSITGAALAGAAKAGAGGSVAHWISFMSTTKFTSTAALAAMLLALGAGVYELRAGRMADAALATDRREVYALAVRVGNAERDAKEAQRRAAQEQSPPAGNAGPGKAVESEAEVNGPFGPSPAGSRARGRALLAAYPEVKELLIRDTRARFSGRYQRLYQELGLTDAQIEAFELILISGVTSGYGEGAETVTLEPSPALTEQEKNERLRQLLGERGFQQFKEFQRSPQDSRVARLAGALYFTDTPLTAAQGAQFQRVLAENGRAYRDQPVQYWAAVREQAAAFLAEPQLAALNGLQASDEYNFAREQNQRLRTAPAGGGAK